jgi:hypothetical protein
MDRLMYLKYAELSSVHQCMYDEERALNKNPSNPEVRTIKK